MRSTVFSCTFAVLVLAAMPATGQDAKLLERGTYLMDSIVACANCHIQRDKGKARYSGEEVTVIRA